MKIADIILIVVVLTVGLGGIFYNMLKPKQQGSILTVYVDNAIYDTKALDKNQVFEIESVNGKNRFAINDYTVSMIEADCHDMYCVKHAPIKYNGEQIVCLPNKVVLEISNDLDLGIDVFSN